MERLFAEPSSPYAGILVLAFMGLAVGAVSILMGWFLRPRQRTAVKAEAYECGMAPAGDARDRVPVRYYTTAMLFLLFDAEAVFLWPWAVSAGREGLFYAVEAFIFIVIVGFGYVYAWRRGAFEWTRS